MLSNLSIGKVRKDMEIEAKVTEIIKDAEFFTQKGAVPVKIVRISDGFTEIKAILWGDEAYLIRVGDKILVTSGYYGYDKYQNAELSVFSFKVISGDLF